jgi:hypothetical protein
MGEQRRAGLPPKEAGSLNAIEEVIHEEIISRHRI